MKTVGVLAAFVAFVVGSYLVYDDSQRNKKFVPEPYQVMDELEKKGILGRDIRFVDKNGKEFLVDDDKGKVIIFSFWATWCEPCVDEFPSFIKLMDQFPEKVLLYAISHDENKKDVDDFINAFKGNRPNIRVVFDPEKTVSKLLNVGLLPEGYIFDSKGLLIKKILGIQDWASPAAIDYFKNL